MFHAVSAYIIYSTECLHKLTMQMGKLSEMSSTEKYTLNIPFLKRSALAILNGKDLKGQMARHSAI